MYNFDKALILLQVMDLSYKWPELMPIHDAAQAELRRMVKAAKENQPKAIPLESRPADPSIAPDLSNPQPDPTLQPRMPEHGQRNEPMKPVTTVGETKTPVEEHMGIRRIGEDE